MTDPKAPQPTPGPFEVSGQHVRTVKEPKIDVAFFGEASVFCSNGPSASISMLEAVANAMAFTEAMNAAPEVAAERDRLKELLTRLSAYSDIWANKDQRDRACNLLGDLAIEAYEILNASPSQKE